MVVRPLIRLENEPAISGLRPNGLHRIGKHIGIVSADSEQNRTGRMGSDHKPVVLVIVIVESRGELLVHLDDRRGVNLPRRSPPGRTSVGEDLIGPVLRSPRRRRERADDSPSVLVPSNVTEARGGPEHLTPRHDLPDGVPIERRRRGGAQHDESGVRGAVFETSPPFNQRGDSLAGVVDIRGEPGSRKCEYRSPVNLPDRSGRPLSMTEPRTKRGIAPGLPRNVWIESNQARISDQVEILRQVADNLRQEKRRAHALESVCVVDADPEDHRRLERSARLKPAAPANLQIDSVRSKRSPWSSRPSSSPASMAADSSSRPTAG